MPLLLPPTIRRVLVGAAYRMLAALGVRLDAWARSRANPAQPDATRDDERGEGAGAPPPPPPSPDVPPAPAAAPPFPGWR